jgi:ApaG protein
MGTPASYCINVAVQVKYLAEQSNESNNRFMFAYTVTISNVGDRAVQLLNRHWVITDANRLVQEVRGEGVIGEQPIIPPGKKFEYTSGTALATQVGTMTGSYQMMGEDGTAFDAAIPQFVLSVPRTLH